jgi:Signal transduction histidine kinase
MKTETWFFSTARTLDAVVAQQDYVWFIAVLAWAAVIAAVVTDQTAPRWLGWLAATEIAAAATELVLLAQNLAAPYTTFDSIMGAVTAAGAAIAWLVPLRMDTGRSRVAAVVVIASAAVLAWVRTAEPVGGGALLVMMLGAGVWRIVRREGGLPRGVRAALAGVVIAAAMAPHGPLAHLAGRGRITTDLSEFAIPCALALVVSGALAASALWRAQWRRILERFPGAGLRLGLLRLVGLLLWWIVAGGALVWWQGRIARRAFEDNLRLRVENAAALLDPVRLRHCLGPELQVTRTEWKRYEDGTPVMVAEVPHTRDPEFEPLREQLRQLHERSPDIIYLYVATLRDGWWIPAANSGDSEPQQGRCVVFRAGNVDDLLLNANASAVLDGPYATSAWGDVFTAKSPLRDLTNGRVLGWLVADVTATTWTASFVQARVLGMTLVAVGVALWTLALAFRLRREEQLAAERRADVLAEADRLKSAFLAKVSHELRTPLQSISGYAELLARAVGEERQQAFVTALRGQAEHMLGLVNDLVDLGAAQAGVLRLRPRPVDLRELISEAVAALRPQAEAKGLRVVLQLRPGVPSGALLDPVRLRQVLLNLVSNSVKFTAEGEVRVEAEVVDDAERAVMAIRVSDSGPGISEELRVRLFEPFTTGEIAGGAGVGLAMSRALCDAMGGSLELVSATRGCCFVAKVPFTPCKPPEAARSQPARAKWRGRRILVVEDNTLVRELLVSFLAENGLEVQAAADAPTALARCEAGPPDLVLLDIGLPGEDGFAVARELRARHASKTFRILGLSALASAEEASRARAAGMDDFLTKPVSLVRLAAAIGGMIEAEPVAPPEAAADSLRRRLEECFRAETPLVLAELQTAVEKRDWERARHRAHYLKNSADVLACAELQDACQRFCATRWDEFPAAAGAAVAELHRLANEAARADMSLN